MEELVPLKKIQQSTTAFKFAEGLHGKAGMHSFFYGQSTTAFEFAEGLHGKAGMHSFFYGR